MIKIIVTKPVYPDDLNHFQTTIWRSDRKWENRKTAHNCSKYSWTEDSALFYWSIISYIFPDVFFHTDMWHN